MDTALWSPLALTYTTQLSTLSYLVLGVKFSYECGYIGDRL